MTQPDGRDFRQLAAETDTVSLVIQRDNPDQTTTLSAEAIDVAGDQVKTWIAARIMHQWKTTGVAPKFVSVYVKVGVE